MDHDQALVLQHAELDVVSVRIHSSNPVQSAKTNVRLKIMKFFLCFQVMVVMILAERHCCVDENIFFVLEEEEIESGNIFI